MCRFTFSKVLTLALTLLLMTISINAEVPQLFNYQGKLMDAQGVPVSDDTYFVEFVIYGSLTADDSLWYSGSQPVLVTDGLFSYVIGSAAPLPDDLFISSPRYLGITVGGDPEISPRTELTSSAFSFQALRSDSTGYALDIADNCVTSSKIQNNSVTGDEIAPNSIESTHIQNGTIQFSDVGPNSAGEGEVMKMIGGSWTAATDDAGSGGGGDITAVLPGSGLTGGGTSGDVTLSVGTGAITTAHLGYNSVTSDKIPDDEITGNDIDHNTIENFHIQNGTLTFNKIGPNGATNNQVMKYFGGNWNAADDERGVVAMMQGQGIAITGTFDLLTVALADGGIFSNHIAFSAVNSNHILDNTIDSNDVAYGGLSLDDLAQSGAQDFEAISWHEGMWQPTAVGDITSITLIELGGLEGGGTSGDIELGIQHGAVQSGHINNFTILDEDISVLAYIDPGKIDGTAATTSGANLFEGSNTFLNLNIIPTTRKMAISCVAFTPQASSAVYTKASNFLRNGVSASQYFYASVCLPDGAVVTQFEATYYDNEAGHNGSAYLYRVSMSTGAVSSMALANTGGTPGMTNVVDGIIDNPEVDNEGYVYGISARLSYSANPNDMRFYGAEIEYTITKPLP